MKKIKRTLARSPIAYFSDLFVVAMVLMWIIILIIMAIVSIIVTFLLHDTSMWSEVSSLCAIPLTAGGAIWMVKNSVQHAIINSRGKLAPKDFPDTGEYLSKEEEL